MLYSLQMFLRWVICLNSVKEFYFFIEYITYFFYDCCFAIIFSKLSWYQRYRNSHLYFLLVFFRGSPFAFKLWVHLEFILTWRRNLTFFTWFSNVPRPFSKQYILLLLIQNVFYSYIKFLLYEDLMSEFLTSLSFGKAYFKESLYGFFSIVI